MTTSTENRWKQFPWGFGEVDGWLAVILCGDCRADVDAVTDDIRAASGASWAYKLTLVGGSRAFVDGVPSSDITPKGWIKMIFDQIRGLETIRGHCVGIVDVKHTGCAAHGLHVGGLDTDTQWWTLNNSQEAAFGAISGLRPDLDWWGFVYDPLVGLWRGRE
jgi:hypothetical protein